MGKDIMFGDIEIKKIRFDFCKNLNLLEYVDIYNIQVSSMVSSGEKNIYIFCWLQR